MGKKNDKKARKISFIEAGKLAPSRAQPRRTFQENKIAELALSIEVYGVLQPLIVRDRGGDNYEIIAGERRWRAAQVAGVTHLPCVFMELVDEDAMAIALIENIQREDLNPIEEANAYHQIKATLGINQEEVAKRVGKDRASVANIMRLLRLPKEIQKMVIEQSISMGHARALLSLSSLDMMIMIAKKVVREGLSVRKCEGIVRAIRLGIDGGDLSGPKNNNPVQREVEQKLAHTLGTRVRIKKDGAGYQIVIHFADSEQLNGVLDVLGVEI